MGQARNRGSYEARKEQAIAAGRIKRKKWSVNQILGTLPGFLTAMANMFMRRG